LIYRLSQIPRPLIGQADWNLPRHWLESSSPPPRSDLRGGHAAAIAGAQKRAQWRRFGHGI